MGWSSLTMMFLSRVARAGGGGMADKMFPGYQDKIWKRLPAWYKTHKVNSVNSQFEGEIAKHRNWQKYFLQYKGIERSLAPSAKYRKIAVDWRRQMERGTMHYGRWYEGPYGSDYRPGNTFDRLANVRAPYTDAEWEERKNYRSFDILKFTWILLGIFLAYRVTNEWPVVWCEEEESHEK